VSTTRHKNQLTRRRKAADRAADVLELEGRPTRPRRRKPDRAMRGYRSAGPGWAERTRKAAAMTDRQRHTAFQTLIAGRAQCTPGRAAELAETAAELLSGNVDDDGLSRIRQTTVASRLGVWRETISRRRAALAAIGVLIVHAAPHRPREDDPTLWETTGPNGYELAPDVARELAAAEAEAQPEPAKTDTAPRPSQPHVYRGDSTVTSSLTRPRRPAEQRGPARISTHDYADDAGLGVCDRCELPRANARHR
jgi:hypothetical protein